MCLQHMLQTRQRNGYHMYSSVKELEILVGEHACDIYLEPGLQLPHILLQRLNANESYLTCGVNRSFSHVRKSKKLCAIICNHPCSFMVLGSLRKFVIQERVDDWLDSYGVDSVCAPSDSDGCVTLTWLKRFENPVLVIPRHFLHPQIQVLC